MALCAAHILDKFMSAVEQSLRPTVKLTALILKNFPEDTCNLPKRVIFVLHSANCINKRRNDNFFESETLKFE